MNLSFPGEISPGTLGVNNKGIITILLISLAFFEELPLSVTWVAQEILIINHESTNKNCWQYRIITINILEYGFKNRVPEY